MKLHVTLQFGSLERSFFVSCDQDNRTFKWLAKVVFHRYTIFVPEVDKVPPPYMQLHAEANKETLKGPNTFSPPMEANISDFVSAGDTIVCRLESNLQSSDICIKFFLNYSGKGSERGCTYYVILSTKKQEVCLV
jgi:hypothetical protein